MCVALPGLVVSIEGNYAVVDFDGNRVNARAGLVDVIPGDYVLVHAGCIIQKMTRKDADEITEIMNEERVAYNELRQN